MGKQNKSQSAAFWKLTHQSNRPDSPPKDTCYENYVLVSSTKEIIFGINSLWCLEDVRSRNNVIPCHRRWHKIKKEIYVNVKRLDREWFSMVPRSPITPLTTRKKWWETWNCLYTNRTGSWKHDNELINIILVTKKLSAKNWYWMS